GLLRHLLAELRTGVAGAVGVVLPGDAGHDLLERLRGDAVLLRVRGGEEAEHRRGGYVPHPAGAVVRRSRDGETGEAGILELLDADRHHHVEGAAGDRVAGVAKGLGP